MGEPDHNLLIKTKGKIKGHRNSWAFFFQLLGASISAFPIAASGKSSFLSMFA